MDYSLILNNINKHITLNTEEVNYFVSLLQERKIKKKQFLFHENQINNYSAFVTNGCLRAYTINDNGEEHILQFAPSDWWIADMYSFITQQPGNINIDAIEESEILILSKEKREDLLMNIPKFERYFRIIIEKSLVANRQRIIERLSLTAKERYNNFCNTYPTLINKIPQKQIASYIGVTPEFLSKIRSLKNA